MGSVGAVGGHHTFSSFYLIQSIRVMRPRVRARTHVSKTRENDDEMA
jgi:hypothetical protein